MRMSYLLLALVISCGRCSSHPASAPEPGAGALQLLAAVGAEPRGYADISLPVTGLQEQVAQLMTTISSLGGKPAGNCIEMAGIERIRVAVGAPLRIAAEIDGKISADRVACLVGGGDALAQRGVVVRDRPHGVAIEYQASPTQTTAASAAELERRCGEPGCAAVVLGPATKQLWIQLRLGKSFDVKISGPALGGGAAAFVAAVDQLRPQQPALAPLTARNEQGTLHLEFPGDPSKGSTPAIALAIRTHLLEVFQIPSVSMIPTLELDDQVFVAKGAWGRPAPGDLVVYTAGDQAYVKRYLAGPGQTIAESAEGISIDGKLLPTELVKPDFRYRDRNERGEVAEHPGSLVREHLGARSYLTLKTGPPRTIGKWKVPEGHVFFVGDNRSNSNDSRYQGASSESAIVGRAICLWFALRDGAPDWDRMGVLPE